MPANNVNQEMPDYKKLPTYFAHTDGNATDEAVIITGEGETLTIKQDAEAKTVSINGTAYYNKEWVDAKVLELEGKISANTSAISTNTGNITSLTGRVTTLEGRVTG